MQGCETNGGPMLDCVLMACASGDGRTRLVGDCWTKCSCVGQVREEYVGQCVVGTAVEGDIGSGGCVSDREGRRANRCR